MKNFTVTLSFKSQFDKDFFMGQLSDGFGENYVDLTFDSDGVMHVDPSADSELYEHAMSAQRRRLDRIGDE